MLKDKNRSLTLDGYYYKYVSERTRYEKLMEDILYEYSEHILHLGWKDDASDKQKQQSRLQSLVFNREIDKEDRDERKRSINKKKVIKLNKKREIENNIFIKGFETGCLIDENYIITLLQNIQLSILKFTTKKQYNKINIIFQSAMNNTYKHFIENRKKQFKNELNNLVLQIKTI